MSPVSELRGTVYVGLEAVPCIALRIVMDEAWSPFVQAEATIPYTAARAAALDPHSTPASRVVLELGRHWHGAGTLADTSREWATGTLATTTAAWATGTLATTTAAWGEVWEAAWRAPDVLRADLAVRGRAIDYVEGTIVIRAASDELLAQEARVSVTRPQETLRDRVMALLDAAGIPVAGADLGLVGTGLTVEATIPWTTSVFAAAESVLNAEGAHLYCSENRQWLVSPPAYAAPSATVALSRVSEAADETDRDGDYADAIVFTATATTAAGAKLSETRVWPDPIPPAARVAVEQQDFGVLETVSAFISPSYLASRLARRQTSGRELRVVAVADPTVRPRMGVTTGAPASLGLVGVVSRVEWAVPADTMTVTIRAVEES